MSRLRIALTVSTAVVLVGCPEPHGLPGDELVGTYAFVATRKDGGCEGLAAVSGTAAGSFEFTATVTRCAADSPSPLCAGAADRAFFTVGVQDFDAGFDGQYLTVFPHSARRSFDECGAELTRMEEAMHLAVFSASQRDAVGSPFACPPNALDGGVPTPDGGVVAPGPGPNGFDAVVACGVATYAVVNDSFGNDGGTGVCRTADAGVKLPGGRCTFEYTLRGDRR